MSQRLSDEERIVRAIAKSRYDPLRFVLFAFPWGEGELKAFPDGPDVWQRDMLMALHDHMIGNRDQGFNDIFRGSVKSGHGIGKSALLAMIIIYFMSTRIDCKGVVTANTATQLETKTWPELAKWHKLAINRHWFKWTATRFCHVEDPENWRFDCIPWSEERTEGFAGLHNSNGPAIAIFDEASAIPDLIWEVTEGAMTDKEGEPYWFVFGNPTLNTGRFFECFNKFAERWKHFTVDSRKSSLTNKKTLNEWIEDYGIDSDFVKVRILGEFPDLGDEQFIDLSVIREAMARSPTDDVSDVVMGVDIARQGSDDSVIVVRMGRNLHKKHIFRYKTKDLMVLVGHIAEKIEQFKPDACFIDGTAVGGGVVDRLKQLGYRVTEVNFSQKAQDEKKYCSAITEMWARMREWLDTASIPEDDGLLSQLRSQKIIRYDPLNRPVFETKEERKKNGGRSMDLSDALALTFRFRVASAEVRSKRNVPRVAESEYDMFNT